VKTSFALIAAVLAVVGNVPYVVDVIRGKVRPHAYSWFVWSIVSCVVFFGQVVKGAGIGAIPTAASEIFTFIIFALSLRFGFAERTRSDTLFLILALLGLIPWILTKDPTLSVVIVVCIDVVAFMPTLRKTWSEPGTEHPILYASNVLRHVLALFSLQAYNIATVFHSIAMILTNTVMTTLILVPGNVRVRFQRLRVRTRLKRALVHTAGILCVLLGIIGLVLPILQGIFFLVLGLVLLSLVSERISRWIEKHIRRYPEAHSLFMRIHVWITEKIGSLE